MAPVGGTGGWTADLGRVLLGVGTELVWSWRQAWYGDSNEVGWSVPGDGRRAWRCDVMRKERAANGALRGSASD